MSEETVPEATPSNVAPSPAETAPVETPKEEPVATKLFTQQELDEKVEKRLAKERARNERERIRILETALNNRQQPNEPQPKKTDDGPKREDFDDYEQYIEARSEYIAEKKIAERETKREQEAKWNSWQERIKEAAKKIPDIEDILRDSDAPLTGVMQDAILDADNGPEIAHYLDQNPDEAARIAKLKPVAQVKELAKIESNLKAPPPPKQASNAPEPITPVGQKASASTDDPSDKDDIREWMRKRNKQVRGR